MSFKTYKYTAFMSVYTPDTTRVLPIWQIKPRFSIHIYIWSITMPIKNEKISKLNLVY